MLYALSVINSSRFTDKGCKRYASGKAANPVSIKDYLVQHNISVSVTREPGGVFWAEKIRELLPDKASEAISGQAESLTMFVARARHIKHIIEPALVHVLHTLSGLCSLNFSTPSSMHGLVK